MKRELWELKQLQCMTLQEKIARTARLINDWKEYWAGKGENVYLSWSGGKDSTVLCHIADTYCDDIKRVFVDTGLEYPELREFVIKHPNVIVLRPQKPFWQVVRDYGYPIISKEVSECVENARKHLNGGGVFTALQKTLWTWRICLKECKR